MTTSTEVDHAIAIGTPSPPPPAAGTAAGAVVSLGFVDHANLPHVVDEARLIVALRPSPTLTHFDPEVVSYWGTQSGRGERRLISRVVPVPARSEFAWGDVEIVDHL